MIENSYSSPKSNLTESVTSEIGHKFVKTRIMNAIAVIAYILMGAVLFLQRSNLQDEKFPAIFAIVFSVMIGIMISTPLLTALALGSNSRSLTRLFSIVLNVICLVFFVISIVGVFVIAASEESVKYPVLMSLISGALMFFIPQLINLRALKLSRRMGHS